MSEPRDGVLHAVIDFIEIRRRIGERPYTARWWWACNVDGVAVKAVIYNLNFVV